MHTMGSDGGLHNGTQAEANQEEMRAEWERRLSPSPLWTVERRKSLRAKTLHILDLYLDSGNQWERNYEAVERVILICN